MCESARNVIKSKDGANPALSVKPEVLNSQQIIRQMLNGFSLFEMRFDEHERACGCRLLETNSSFERLTGRNRTVLFGRDLRDTLPWLEKYIVSTYKKVIKNGDSVHSFHFFNVIDKHLEITAYSPAPGYLTVMFSDVTQSKKDEEEKKLLATQLIQSQKIEAIGRLAGGIAHDFNNLLTAIMGYTDLALLQINNEAHLKDSLQQVRLAAQRAANLVHQLLIFGREEPMVLRPHNLTLIIENLLKMLKRIIGEHITINLELSRGLWMAKVDQGKIEQVIMNLAVNARDAMHNGGKLTIKTENLVIDKKYVQSYKYARTGKFVCFSIADTGIGMDEKTRQKIFEPFFTTKKAGDGTGLGLAVVYGIVKEHQGWINVSSTPGKGSRFEICLPACFEKYPLELSQASFPSHEKFAGKGERLLIVEDDTTILEFMKSQLKEKGYTVFSAEDGASALMTFEKEKFGIDLVFIDVVLPDRKGIELVDLFMQKNPGIKVLLTSGYLDIKSEWPVIEKRKLKFIEKPYTFNELHRVIRELIDQPNEKSK